jgi:hypothetical protein
MVDEWNPCEIALKEDSLTDKKNGKPYTTLQNSNTKEILIAT